MNKIDIVFIHPNASQKIYQELSKDFAAIEPPIWAAMLAKHCLLKGFAVELLDCEALGLTHEAAAEQIKNIQPRVACFVIYGQQPSASTQNMVGALALAETLKKLAPSIKTLFVGGHVSALSQDVLEKHPAVDMVCQNEGVYTISELLQTNLEQKLDQVKGLGYRDGQTVILNAPSPIVPREHLARDLPGMAWELLPLQRYRTALWHAMPNDGQRQPFAALYTSLGCPMRCTFCMINIINRQENEYSDGSAVFRYWDPDFMIKEFDILAQQGIKNIKIADELFVLNRHHFLAICNKIIERGYNFNIWCYARVDTVKEEYLATLKKAGVNFLALGIESGDTRVRKDVTKGRFEDVDIRDIVAKIRSHGINVAANYIFGLPEDDLDSMQTTLDLALELNTEMANFYSAMAYPGSPLYGMAVKENWLLPDSYVGYSQHAYETTPLPTKYLSSHEVLKFRDEAWLTYHRRPEFLDLIRNKFGEYSYQETLRSTKINLKRKLIEKAIA